MHGPGPVSPTNPLGWQPQYPQPIEVTDTLIPTFKQEARRQYWRRKRDAALARWPIAFEVTEEAGPTFDGYYETPMHTLVHLGAITIVRSTVDPPGDTYYKQGWAWWGGDGANPGTGGLVLLKPTRFWWLLDFKLAAHVAHEIGHTLGLWHRSDAGIMAGGWKPDEHDLASIRDWYGEE